MLDELSNAARRTASGLLRQLRDAEWRRTRSELRRLRRMPRRTPGSAVLGGEAVAFHDAGACVHAWTEIFERGIYRLPSGAAPRGSRILDVGANVGLSTLHFARRFPEADLVAWEPDPTIFDVLRTNAEHWGLRVELRNTAVWRDDVELPFFADGSDAGRLGRGGDPAAGDRVPAERLSPFLAEGPVALLKLDIEGAELPVLEECRNALGPVERIFVEVHSFAGEPQPFVDVLSILRDAGFRAHVHSERVTAHPFVDVPVDRGMEQRWNVFAVREGRSS